jgi:hypothetical protein
MKATTPKKEMTPLGRTIDTNKCGDRRATARGRKAHQAAANATKVATEMAIVLQVNAKVLTSIADVLGILL